MKALFISFGKLFSNMPLAKLKWLETGNFQLLWLFQQSITAVPCSQNSGDLSNSGDFRKKHRKLCAILKMAENVPKKHHVCYQTVQKARNNKQFFFFKDPPKISWTVPEFFENVGCHIGSSQNPPNSSRKATKFWRNSNLGTALQSLFEFGTLTKRYFQE